MLHTAGIFSANALNNAVALGVMLAAATLMPLAEFGVLGLAVALVVIAATLTDWGLSTALVRAASRAPAQATAAGAFVRIWKLLLLLALVALALAIPAGALAWLWPGLADRVTLAVTLLSAGLLGCWIGRRAFEQAREHFAALHRAAVACAALRVLSFAAIVAAGAVKPVTVLLCLYVVPLLALLGWQDVPDRRQGIGDLLRTVRDRRQGIADLLVLPLDSWQGADLRRAATLCRLPLAGPQPTRTQMLRAGGELLRYSGWVGVSALCFVAFTRAPVLALGSFGTPHDLGVFTGALTFTLAFAMLGDALRTVALPRIVRAADARECADVRAWLRRLAEPVLALATVALLLIALVYELILGPAHAGGARLLLIMGLAVVASIGLGLHNALLHALAQPQLEAAVNVSRLLAFACLSRALPATPFALATAYALVLVMGELALYALVRAEEQRVNGMTRLAIRRLALGKGLPTYLRRLAGRVFPTYKEARTSE